MPTTSIPLPGGSANVPTGPMQFNNDWPGLFIRGDDCLAVATELIRIRDKLQSISSGTSLPHKTQQLLELIIDEIIQNKELASKYRKLLTSR